MGPGDCSTDSLQVVMAAGMSPPPSPGPQALPGERAQAQPAGSALGPLLPAGENAAPAREQPGPAGASGCPWGKRCPRERPQPPSRRARPGATDYIPQRALRGP